MIPLKDDNPTRRFPFVNYLLIVANIIVYIWMLQSGQSEQALVHRYAMIPADFLHGFNQQNITTIFTSMFMHAGLLHIGGNMLYLWIFGDNIEDRLGHLGYLFFYLVGGLAASLAHIYTNPGSSVPTVGASGAIAAVLGAYLVLFPTARILTFIPLGFFSQLTMVPAVLVLGLWFVLQLFNGVLTMGGPEVGGVAFWAHIGGFVTGMVLGKLFTAGRPSQSVGW